MSAQPDFRYGTLHALAACAFALSAAGTSAATYTDDFNRTGYPDIADGTHPWVEKENVSGWCDIDIHIHSNHVRTYQCSSSGGYAYWNDTFTDHQYSKVKYSTSEDGGEDRGGPAVRIGTSGTWNNATMYMADYDRNSSVVRLWKFSGQSMNGGGTQLGSDYSVTLSAGDWLELHACGTTLTVKKNAATLFTATDSSISSGKAGVASRYSGAAGALGWNDWEAGDLSGCSGVTLTNQDTWNSSTSKWEGNAYTATYSTAPSICTEGSTERYGTTIKRLTNASANGSTLGNSTNYATQNWFNSDKTKVLVNYGQGGAGVVTRSGCSITGLSGLAMSGNEPRWARHDPDRIFYHAQNGSSQAVLKWRNVSGSFDDTIATFTEYAAISNKGQDDVSPDGCRFVFEGTTSGGSKELFVYTMTSGQLGSPPASGCPSTGGKGTALSLGSDTVDFVHIITPHPDRPTDPSHVVVGFTQFNGQGNTTRVYDLNFTTGSAATLANFIGHEDVGYNSSGQQVLVMTNASQPSSPEDCKYSIMRWTLPNTTASCLKYGTNTTEAFPELLAWDVVLPRDAKSEWAYVGLYDDGSASDSDKFRREIVRVRLDGSGYTQTSSVRPWDRIAHTHTHSPDYGTIPQVSISHDGTLLLWGANFRSTGSPDYEEMDAYELVLP